MIQKLHIKIFDEETSEDEERICDLYMKIIL